jgi:hypothetical protein
MIRKMKPSWKNIDSWHSAFRVMSVAGALTVLGAVSASAQAPPYGEFQYATITGSNNVINVTMLPVVTASGVVYKNMTLQFEVSADGTVSLVPGTPTIVAAPTPQVSSFAAGTYVGPGVAGSNQTQVLTLVGPGVTTGGATEWSIKSSSTATGCTYPTSATFYVGPLASNPLYPRLQKAGITSTAYSYGVMGSQGCYTDGASDWWYQGNIVGVSQTGNALTIVTFTYAETTDYATPQGQITYTLQ